MKFELEIDREGKIEREKAFRSIFALFATGFSFMYLGGLFMNDYTLENTNGLRMRVSEIGGAVMELHVPDRFGRFADVVLGHDSVEAYKAGGAYLGALIGRYGNRIANGTFSLDGNVYHLATNNGVNHLHGGDSGFDLAAWKAETISGDGFSGLILNYRSQGGEEGYPGNLDVRVTYKLTNENEWIIEGEWIVY